MPDTELFDGCGQQVKANEATRLRSPKSYTEMTRMFADGGESPYRRSTKSPPRSGRSGQRSASDLRRELRRRHVTTGQLFSMMDQESDPCLHRPPQNSHANYEPKKKPNSGILQT